MLIESLLIQRLARKLLGKESDFILVGGSPVRTGLEMMRQEPHRDYRFVSFSGSWMRDYNYDIKATRRRYDRSSYLKDDLRKSYNRYLHEQGISAAEIADRSTPLNLVDFCSRGESLVSFADVLISDSRTLAQARAVAGKLNLVGVTGARSFRSGIAQSAWTCGSFGLFEVSTAYYHVRHGIWWKQMLGSQHQYEADAPRLTAPYLTEDWLSPPAPARPSNIAAFHRAAQGIDPARLRAAFGPAYSTAYDRK